MTRVDGATQVYAVLGQPVHHSRSPDIQNAAFRAAGMNAVYVALEVPAPRLDQALEGLHAARVLGLNLTAPHKEAAYAMTRHKTPEAEAAKAINTLRWAQDGWEGHATDGIGFLAWAAEAGVDPRGRRVLVLGAGGAARAIVPQLVTLGPKSVHVVSRSAEHARALLKVAPGITSASLAEGAEGVWDVLIRALPAESVSSEEEGWWSAHAPGAVVLDLNYGPRSASARAAAEAARLRYEDGSALLIHQGAASFTFWTGKKASLDAMREALRAAE